MSDKKTTPLNVTQEARHRVFVGLGWNPNKKVSLIDKAREITGGKKTHHDLDLSCYIFDDQKRYINHVSVESGREVDQTGQIYHSGDNVEGIGDGDDEQISVELKDLNPAIHSIIFKASIKSGQNFAEVAEPEMRLADGYTNRNFVHCDLLKITGHDKDAFIFACIFRMSNTEWQMMQINEFIDTTDDMSWPERLKSYLP